MSHPPALGHSRAYAGEADRATAAATDEANRASVIVHPLLLGEGAALDGALQAA
jgi:hypothetical protein